MLLAAGEPVGLDDDALDRGSRRVAREAQAVTRFAGKGLP